MLLFHTLHPDERNLAGPREAVFVDSETGARLPVHAEDIRRDYAERMRAWLASTAAQAKARGLGYRFACTSTDYFRVLERHFLARGEPR